MREVGEGTGEPGKQQIAFSNRDLLRSNGVAGSSMKPPTRALSPGLQRWGNQQRAEWDTPAWH
jgi:hypothetical protein